MNILVNFPSAFFWVHNAIYIFSFCKIKTLALSAEPREHVCSSVCLQAFSALSQSRPSVMSLCPLSFLTCCLIPAHVGLDCSQVQNLHLPGGWSKMKLTPSQSCSQSICSFFYYSKPCLGL